MTAYTTNEGLILPTPGDPAVANVWGALLNTNASLIDSAVSGLLTLSVAGASNVILTSTDGAADQSRNAQFDFTGVLTGNIDVLWPNGKTRNFVVTNSTTGAFTLSCGVNNGSGSPAGTVYAVPQGEAALLRSDGTNITLGLTPVGVGAVAPGANSNITSLSGLTTPLSVAQGGTGDATLTQHGILLGEGTAAVAATAAMTNGQLVIGQTGADPLPKTVSGDATMSAAGALTLANSGVTAASYNPASITVDAKGRVTAASNSPRGCDLFTANGTFTIPVGTTNNTIFRFTVVGGGGGGGGSSGGGGGGGGGAGGVVIVYLSGFTASTDASIVIGAAGTGGASGASGTSGANTTVAYNAVTILTAGLGHPGGGATTTGTVSGGAGGANTVSMGASGITLIANVSYTGMQGCVGHGNASGVVSGAGGSTPLGAGGSSSFGGGVAATGHGGGGGGGGGGSGGNGSAGAVLVEWW